MITLLNSDTAYPDFKRAFCATYGCTAEAFVRELFWKCLNPYWRPVAELVLDIRPEYFSCDLNYLERVGEAENWPQVVLMANTIPKSAALNSGFLRRVLHFRISGARLVKLGEKASPAWLAAPA